MVAVPDFLGTSRISPHGFVRVAAGVPRMRVADCEFNAHAILDLLRIAEEDDVQIVALPELCLTGYTCGDLFQQDTLRRAALGALNRLAAESRELFSGLFVVGLPFAVHGKLYNCAAVISQGAILGLVPKSYIPNYKEFYEVRWFAALDPHRSQNRMVEVGGRPTPFGTRLLFQARELESLTVGVEICEDLWVPIPPSSHQALAGAKVMLNLSASNEVIGKAAYRRQLVASQSGRCFAAYVYAASGVSESTTDLVFGGHAMIAENGVMLREAPRFQQDAGLLIADVDLDRLENERLRSNTFGDGTPMAEDTPWQRVPFSAALRSGTNLRRTVEAHPFVPRGSEQLRERCEEIFQTQVTGLAQRLKMVSEAPVVIGVSGGLDSTLALLVTCKTFDLLGKNRARVQALTMPGFGTSTRTYGNACALMKELGVTSRDVDIRELCLHEMRALGHAPFGIRLDGMSVESLGERLQALEPGQRRDLTFENVQARMRTSILMNAGFVVGTGDLSELALGWCTYNADHMSMYNPNGSIPKTLVRFLVRWAAEHEFRGECRRILRDIAATQISPELLPLGPAGELVQSTEEVIGPYELHDFFLYHFLRYGAHPDKILYLAQQASFDQAYEMTEICHWLRLFLQRFFANQFKRSCLPDGPKVGTISLSPRGDWRMPSDAHAAAWLAVVDETAREGPLPGAGEPHPRTVSR